MTSNATSARQRPELAEQRIRLHPARRSPIEGATLTRHFTALLRRIRFHDLRHSAATPLLEQGVELVVIKELLGHAHIGVTATVYAHVRLRLQRQAIDALSNALQHPAYVRVEPYDGDDLPLCAAPVRSRCRQDAQKGLAEMFVKALLL